MSSEKKRDPKVDPKPGDRLTNWGCTPGAITITQRIADEPSAYVWFISERAKRRETLDYFRRMATNAEVVFTAK